jgi:esterase/lipase
MSQGLNGLWLLFVLSTTVSYAQPNESFLHSFYDLHATTLTATVCHNEPTLADAQFVFCAEELRNAGNAPFVLWHRQFDGSMATDHPVVVLLHGLSDSPFYLQSVAQAVHQAGMNVVVGLLPGHGLKTNSESILHDNNLRQIWRDYTDNLIAASNSLGNGIVVGGFSTGGALAVDHILRYPGQTKGLLLFSGALALADNAETLSKIPFAKWLSKWIDGDYPEAGTNPYKYPNISSHAALILMDIIRNIRTGLHDSTGLKLPIFVAHSQSDNVTPIAGVEGLLSFSVAEHTVIQIAESMAVCHAAVPLTKQQVQQINEKDPNPLVNCDSPEYNPVHAQMIAMMQFYLLNSVK